MIDVDVLVFGSAIMDFICYTPRLPKAGETLHGNKFQTGFGGKGANQCVAAARLGAKTALIAKLGDDTSGNDYLQHLQEEGVNVEHVEKLKGQTTGIAQIAVSDEGENNIIIVVGANNLLSAADVNNARAHFDAAKVLICQLETPLAATLEALRAFRGTSIVNGAPAMADTPKELLQLSSIFCVNETEAALMTGTQDISTISDAENAVQRLMEMGANTVIVTLGKLGAVFATKTEPTVYTHVPTPHVQKVVDTTGAGDAFIGALAFSIARYPEHSLKVHVTAACKVASISVQNHGTQSSFPCFEICNNSGCFV